MFCAVCRGVWHTPCTPPHKPRRKPLSQHRKPAQFGRMPYAPTTAAVMLIRIARQRNWKCGNCRRVCQNDASSFCITKPRLSQAGALPCLKELVTLDIEISHMAKIHYRSYNPNQIILFPQRIDEDIAENDPVRIISAVIDMLDLSKWTKLLPKTNATLVKRWNSLQINFHRCQQN